MRADTSLKTAGYSVVRKWLAGALLLSVLVAGGLVAAGSTATAQSATLNPDNCAAGGAWVPDASNTALAQDCRALVGAHNAWVGAGTNDAGSLLGTWGTGPVSSWVGVQVASRGVNRAAQHRVVGVHNPHASLSGGPAIGLNGGMPAALCNLSALEQLVITTGNGWVGSSLPACLNSGLPNLRELNLSYTGLGGSLSNSWCTKPNLAVLSLGGNNLSGIIPTCLGQSNGNQNLTVVQLESNRLLGGIPATMARSSQLRVVDLSDNHLDGGLPSGWANIISLAVGSNNLSGNLPSSLGANGNLIRFNADTNKFTGSIPAQWTNPGRARIDRVAEFDVSDNRLSGIIDVNWLDAISFVNVNHELTVELDHNNFCFSSPRAIDTPGLLPPTANETLSVPGLPAYNSDGSRIPSIAALNTAQVLSGINVRNQNCNTPSLAESNLTPRMMFPSSVTESDTGLTVNWEASANPNTGSPYDITVYAVVVSGPGDVSDHFIASGFSIDPYVSAVDGAVGDLIDVPAVYERSGAHVEIVLGSSGATSANLVFAGADRLPADEYVITVWPFFARGTINLNGFNTVFAPSDQASGTWRSINVLEAGVTEGRALRSLESRTAFAWNAAAQNWDRLDDPDSTAPLAVGTGLMMRQGDTTNPLNWYAAGAGRFDVGDRYTLYPGWNLLAPPIALGANELNPADNPALFWNDQLWGCSSNPALNHGGVAVIFAYNADSNRWKAHVTCRPDLDVEAQGFLPLTELDVSDSVFVYFNSREATPEGVITWDNAAREFRAG